MVQSILFLLFWDSPVDAVSTESPGVLYVIATPIGNLEDATFRSIRVLKEVALVAAEDTRRTGVLLRHYGIQTPTRSYHAHNEHPRSTSLIRTLETGKSIALVTDAGTPLLSDPGRTLVNKALNRGIRVSVIPGVSAVLTALVGSGLAELEFTFLGFPPPRSNSRKKWFLSVSQEPRPLVIFEAPHRISRSLEDMLEVMGDRRIAVCREMTKLHEEVIRGPISIVISQFSSVKGELTVVVEPAKAHNIMSNDQVGSDLIAAEFDHMIDNVGSRREAIRLLAQKHGLPSRSIYETLEKQKLI